MKRALLSILVLFFVLPTSIYPVKAHRLSIVVDRINIVTRPRPECQILDADVERMEILTMFGQAETVENINIKVYDPDGSLYLEGASDEKGRFSFELPIPAKPGRWRIIATYPSPLHTATLDFYMERSIIVEQEAPEAWPIYMTIIAGTGYALGASGLIIGYMSRKAKKKLEQEILLKAQSTNV